MAWKRRRRARGGTTIPTAPKRGKYGVKKVILTPQGTIIPYVASLPVQPEGDVYDSRQEALYYRDNLRIRQRLGEIATIERQVLLRLFVVDASGKKHRIGHYHADFVVTLPDGRKEIHETKGVITRDFPMRWKLVQALYNQEYSAFVLHKS